MVAATENFRVSRKLTTATATENFFYVRKNPTTPCSRVRNY